MAGDMSLWSICEHQVLKGERSSHDIVYQCILLVFSVILSFPVNESSGLKYSFGYMVSPATCCIPGLFSSPLSISISVIYETTVVWFSEPSSLRNENVL